MRGKLRFALIQAAVDAFDAVDETALKIGRFASDFQIWCAAANLVKHHGDFASGQVGAKTEVWAASPKANLNWLRCARDIKLERVFEDSFIAIA